MNIYHVRVHVDEARRDDQALGVDDPRAGGVEPRSNGRNGVALDADVGDEPRVAGPVDDAAALRLRCRRWVSVNRCESARSAVRSPLA